MTKQEAKAHISGGQMVTHKYMEPDEYVEKDNVTGWYKLSGKYSVEASMFWADRRGWQWDDGWEIYSATSPNKEPQEQH